MTNVRNIAGSRRKFAAGKIKVLRQCTRGLKNVESNDKSAFRKLGEGKLLGSLPMSKTAWPQQRLSREEWSVGRFKGGWRPTVGLDVIDSAGSMVMLIDRHGL